MTGGFREQGGSTITNMTSIDAPAIDLTSSSYLEATLRTLSGSYARLNTVASNLKKFNRKFIELATAKKAELKALQAEEKENGFRVTDCGDVLVLDSSRLRNRNRTRAGASTRAQDRIANQRQVLGPINDTNTRVGKFKATNKPVKPKRGSEVWRRKVDLENRDFTLRNQIAGIETMTELTADAFEKITYQQKKLKELYKLGHRLLGREAMMEEKDMDRLIEAEQDIQDGTAVCEEVEGMLKHLGQWFESLEGKGRE